jgi:hypothetical protein
MRSRFPCGVRALVAGSIHLQPTGFDRVFPSRDLVGDELGEVFGASSLWRKSLPLRVISRGKYTHHLKYRLA